MCRILGLKPEQRRKWVFCRFGLVADYKIKQDYVVKT